MVNAMMQPFLNLSPRAMALALVAALIAGNVGAVRAAESKLPPNAADFLVVPPGRIHRAVGSIDGFARALLRKTGVPGMAVAVVHDGKLVYAKGFGVRRVGTHEKVDAHTVFELASISKSLASTVIAGEVGRGVVKWNDPIAKYVPGFTLADPWVGEHVTIADMFSHRSGLPEYAGDRLEDLGYNRATILRRLALEPLAPFRVTYAYTNFGITAAGQAVANAADTSWEALSQRVLYGPLGMTSTSSRYADYAKRPDRAVLHVREGGVWTAKYTRDADAQAPAGGASSDVLDMAKWMELELGNGTYHGKALIDRNALLATRVPQMVTGPLSTPESRASFYGLGVGVGYDEAGRVRWSHSGAFASGAATTYVLLPSEHLGIVVLTNGMPIGVPETLANDFMDVVEFGKVQRDWFAAYSKLLAGLFVNPSELAHTAPPANPTPARPDADYIGTYANAYYGPATIERQGGSLVMLLGPLHKAFPLRHWNGDVFAYDPTGENAVGPSAFTFAIGSDGHASSVVVENLNENGLGTFKRIQP